MALAGTIDTFPLGSVMSLLEATSARGVLRFGGGADAELHIADGALVGTAPASAADPVPLLARLLGSGATRFAFDDGAEPSPTAAPRSLSGVLAAAEVLAAEWAEMRLVAPDVTHRAVLDPSGDPAGTALGAVDWRLICMAGSTATMADIATGLGVTPLEAHRGVRRLRDAGLVRVVAPTALPSVATAPAAVGSPVHPAPRGGVTEQASSAGGTATVDSVPGVDEQDDVDPVEALLAGIDLPDTPVTPVVTRHTSTLFRAVNRVDDSDGSTPPPSRPAPSGSLFGLPMTPTAPPVAAAPPMAPAPADPAASRAAMAESFGMPGPVETGATGAVAVAVAAEQAPIDALGDRGPWRTAELAELVEAAQREEGSVPTAELTMVERMLAGRMAGDGPAADDAPERFDASPVLPPRPADSSVVAGSAAAPADHEELADGSLAGRPVDKGSLLRFFTGAKA